MVSRRPTATMSYINYDTDVVQKYSVRLVGYPFPTVISPHQIHTIDAIQTLRDALHAGTCHWLSISGKEVHQHAIETTRRLDTGEIIKKRRKERSDKGKKKGPRTPRVALTSTTDDQEPPAKRHKAMLPPKTKTSVRNQLPLSSQNIPSDSDNPDSEDSGASGD